MATSSTNSHSNSASNAKSKRKQPAKLLIIHSGQQYHRNLGTHYGPLIKHSLGLVPISQYLSMSPTDKRKYRAIQSLPTGHLLAIALIDGSFPFKAEHAADPWVCTPFCSSFLTSSCNMTGARSVLPARPRRRAFAGADSVPRSARHLPHQTAGAGAAHPGDGRRPRKAVTLARALRL